MIHELTSIYFDDSGHRKREPFKGTLGCESFNNASAGILKSENIIKNMWILKSRSYTVDFFKQMFFLH